MGYEPKQKIQKTCPSGKKCLEHRCALWCEIQKCCAIKLIATALGDMNYRQKIEIENRLKRARESGIERVYP